MGALKKRVAEYNLQWIDHVSDIEETVRGMFHANTIMNTPVGKEIGAEGSITHGLEWSKAFPTCNIDKMDIYSNDDNTVVHVLTMSGRHENDFLGIAATGRKIYVPAIAVWRFDDQGNLEECSYKSDILGIFQQMGHRLEKDAFSDPGQVKRDFGLIINTLIKMGTDKQLLSKREVCCLAMYLFCHCKGDMTAYLNVSPNMIHEHITHGMEKLGCRSKEQLMELVSSRNLLHIFRDLYQQLLRRVPQVE